MRKGKNGRFHAFACCGSILSVSVFQIYSIKDLKNNDYIHFKKDYFMEKKKFLWMSVLCAAMTLPFTACSDDDDDDTPPDPELHTTGVYILNSGNFGDNNATLDFYNPDTKALQKKVFSAANNGQGLGDVAQSILIYGSKMYIAVGGSNSIAITDLSGKLLNRIVPTDGEIPRSPRYFAAYNGKVYATLFDGHVARIDTALMSIETLVTVGDNPEEIVVANGKLYVANSGGMNFPVYGNTVSVIDINSFSVSNTLQVVINPQYLEVDSKGDVYLISTGNYADVSPTLQRIDTKTDAITKIEDFPASLMSLGADDKLYIVSSQYDENWNLTAEYYVYDADRETWAGKFITDGTPVANPYSISADPLTGNVYIGTSDYISTGDVYIFTSGGKSIDKLAVSGINPIGVGYLTK
jgi:hypothetical protein